MKSKLPLCILLCVSLFSKAQCPVGEVEVSINVYTDDFAYEAYWQLLPAGNACDTGTIFSGGNTLVGCGGGGLKLQQPGGYPNNTIIPTGPWCLTLGASFDLLYIDDWGDGGTAFTVMIDGYPMYTGVGGNGDSAGSRFTFIAAPPLAYDLACQKIRTASYETTGDVDINGTLFNNSSTTITTLDLNYSIDNGPPVTSNITGLTLLPFTAYEFVHPVPWNITVDGVYSVKAWAENLNGNADMNLLNDSASRIVTIGPPVPNIIDDYLFTAPVLTVIADTNNGVLVPRDLDFHPILTRYELWVVLKSTENIGGKTVKISNAGKPNQTSQLQQDGNAWHFMSLPTGIAFSDNENFATSPGVYDANHDGGSPFTGPTLWSSDSLIYAQPSGGNGSHIDMLHQSPYSMGICHEADNIFWVYDDNASAVVRYDFVNDHGPGNSDHSDGIIRRFTGLGLDAEATHHVASHLVLQKESGMLYIVDNGNARVLRMDINSGSFFANLTPYEPVAEFSSWSGANWSTIISSGLTMPSGIDLIDDRLIVSDYATGEIVIYDISSPSVVELGRITTGTPGIMGVKIGPEGKIWYVNATTSQVVRIDGLSLGMPKPDVVASLSIYPNPASTRLNLVVAGHIRGELSAVIYNSQGQQIKTLSIPSGQTTTGIDISGLSAGIYEIQLRDSEKSITKTFIKE